jgi:hypothetical protein
LSAVLARLAVTPEAARDEGMERVASGVSLTWTTRARMAVLRVARRQQPFTPDDIWDTGLPRPRDARALGPIMMALAREGLIKPTGRWVKSRYATQHATPIREWIGVS